MHGIKSHELVVRHVSTSLTQFHHLIIDSLTTGGIERTLVGVHHTLLRRTEDAGNISIATFLDTDILISKLADTNKTTPYHRSDITAAVDI